VTIDGQPRTLADLPLNGKYAHPPLPDGEDAEEYVVPVAWHHTLNRQDAVWVKGMFANQNSACKLRNHFTLEHLATAFKLGDAGS